MKKNLSWLLNTCKPTTSLRNLKTAFVKKFIALSQRFHNTQLTRHPHRTAWKIHLTIFQNQNHIHMLRSFRIKCLIEIEGQIETPDHGYFVKNHESIRLAYLLEGKLKYITLSTPEEVAALLKHHNLIDGYALTNTGVRMYQKTFITVAGKKGEPVQQQRMTVVTWKDINLNSTQVQTIAAAHEFNLAGNIMGKVVEITKNYLKAA